MVRERRGPTAVALVVVALVAVIGGLAVTRSDQPSATVAPQAEPPQAVSTTPPPATGDDAPAAGRTALVTVAVATVWNEPGRARPVDQPSLTNPVDIDRWLASMSHEDKLWLVDHLATQALYGERVSVREISGDWARVVVTGQPSSIDPNGYPGWVPKVQLRAADPATPDRTAVVTRPKASLRDVVSPDRELLQVSYNTRLPVVGNAGADVVVGLPTGSHGMLALADVEVVAAGAARPATGVQVVRSAQLFSGLPYLWAGTSAAGFDCSGFTAAVYGVHGIVIPRDANDQAAAGAPVDRSALQPGDLLFYSTDGQQRSIHHVSMYVGNGMMIQSPATGRTVETVPVDTPQYARQFWGARRYLPSGGP